MKVTLFSSNQPRHLHLAKTLSKIAEEVYFISEVNTVFPGKIKDFFQKTEVMQRYFENVMLAEKKVFGDIDFLPSNVTNLSIKSGDLNFLSQQQMNKALNSDVYVVFGASYIKGWLIDFLITNQALNIHMGISPYYRGSSCNFWALYDNNPSYVGATIHMLSKGLDSGDMLFHCLPKFIEGDTLFDFTMRSVAAVHYGLSEAIQAKELLSMSRIKQDHSQEVRYTRNSDFTDEVAAEFLSRQYEIKNIDFDYPNLLDPLFY
jgi:folate-dependent phosphoribosylglycinamide formyltransferase PurN